MITRPGKLYRHSAHKTLVTSMCHTRFGCELELCQLVITLAWDILWSRNDSDV